MPQLRPAPRRAVWTSFVGISALCVISALPAPASAAKPAPPPASAEDWAPRPPAPGVDPLSVDAVELQPSPDARVGGSGLGPHQAGLRALPIDVCLHQLAAWQKADLQARLCVDLEVTKKGKVKVDAVVVEPEVPGLGRCVEALHARHITAPGAPAAGRLCRAVQTNFSPEALAAWARDPYATPEAPARRHPPTGLVDRPRALPESAARRGADGAWTAGPLGLREAPVSTALRLVEGATEAVRACAGDHAGWRAWTDGVDLQLDVIVNEAGVASVLGAGAAPASFGGAAGCVAARLDPRFPAAEGDVRVPVRVRVRPEGAAAAP